ncbi:MAG: hypothetical protein R3B48_29160 [Kofleriaceae bacterium]
MLVRRGSLLVLLTSAGCVAGAVFPADVQEAFRDEPMRRAETANLELYFPAARQAQVERFAARAERCAAALKAQAQAHSRSWAEKMTITMPEVAFNNAYVSPKIAGSPDISVVPTFSSLDFTTEFGLPPDPGFIACHELVHYVHGQQITGLWSFLNLIGGDLFTPQVGFDPWFFEGLATHYEASLQPGVGRPRWPVFTGMFAAAYAGKHVSGGDLSEYGRRSPVGHHYLVGTMFIDFLVKRYGEAPLWKTIAAQSSGWTWLFAAHAFRPGFGKSLGALLDEFDAWHYEQYPVRARPSGQRRLADVGNDARYARGRDGSEAWIADDLDLPTRLIVRGRDGRTRAEVTLTEVLPPRQLAIAAPILISGLSLTADGQEVWFTAIDRGASKQTTRLMRWRARDGLHEVASGLGPGGTIDGEGKRYFFSEVDGDRWSLAVYDVATGAQRTLLDAAPGTYVLTSQLSPDGATLAASAWNGEAFTIWLIDAARGTRLRELRGQGPLYDPAFLDDGRLVSLGVVDGRFQILLDNGDRPPQFVTDAPYAILAPRGSASSLRFLNREGWSWTLDEIALPPAAAPAPVPSDAVPTPSDAVPTPGAAAPTPSAGAPLGAAALGMTPTGSAALAQGAGGALTATSTPPAPGAGAAQGAPIAPSPLTGVRDYSVWDGFFFPSLHAPSLETSIQGALHLGVTLGGSDVLGAHSWLLSGYVQPRPKDDDGGPYYGAAGRYFNTMLAPWNVLAQATSLHGVERIEPETAAESVTFRDRRTTDALLLAGRAWRGSWLVAGGALATRSRTREPDGLVDDRKVAGPLLTLSYGAASGTAYTGLHRAVIASATASFFPKAWSSLERDATRARGALTLVTPLPWTRRHSLQLQGVGHAILPASDLIELGGASAFAPLYETSNRPDPVEPSVGTPPNARLLEPLRGYEDTTFAVSRAFTGELSWSYPLILDRGVASTLLYFPSSFLRQLDLDLFAAGALSAERGRSLTQHLAAGGALTLSFTFLRVPLALRYQIARRFRDDDAVTQVLGLGGG